MPDADSSVDVLIRVSSDAAGAAPATQAINEATTATTKGAASSEEASKATEKHTVGLHAMHRVFHALNEVVPGLGAVMQAAFSPVGAVISIAVMALSLFREHLKKVNEELDRMEEENVKPLTNRLEIMRESVIHNSASMVEFNDRLADASRSQRTLKDDIEQVVGAMRNESQVLQTLAENSGREQLTELDTLHKAGLVSEQQYAAERLKIEQDLADKKRKLVEDELQAEINIRKGGLEAAKKDQPGKDNAAAAARDKAESAATESEVAKSGMEIAKENAKTTAAALAKWQKEHASWSFEGALHAAMFGGNGAEEAKKDIAENQRLKDAAALADKAMKQAPKDVAKKEWEATEAADEYHRKLAAAEAGRTLMTAGQEEVAQKERELESKKKADAQVSNAQREAGTLTTPIGQAATVDVQEAIGTAKALEQHKQVSEQSRQKLVEVATATAGHAVSLKQAVAMMDWAAKNQGNFVTEVMRLVGAMEQMASGHSALKGRIDAIERQVKQISNQTMRSSP